MGREVKRVPIDFDWPPGQIWEGYLNPYYKHRKSCPACDGTGYSPEAKRFRDEWYGYVPFDHAAYGVVPLAPDARSVLDYARRNVSRDASFYLNDFSPTRGRSFEDAVKIEAARLYSLWVGQWSHHLGQADVDALIANNRLCEFTHRVEPGKGWVAIEPTPIVTAAAVNEWSMTGFGHDSINQWVCVRERCKRVGVEIDCPSCDDGECWPTKAHKALYDAWERVEPPDGDSYQIWETVSEGSPITPPFATPEELARWCVDNRVSAGGYETAGYESWLRVANGGYAPSLVATDGKVMNGVEALTETNQA